MKYIVILVSSWLCGWTITFFPPNKPRQEEYLKVQDRHKPATIPKIDIKKGFKQNAQTLDNGMPEVGIEPTRTQGPEDFESSASTSFTTPALVFKYN